MNIDTDGTDTWYARVVATPTRFGRYKNIDTGDGEGPIHTDTTAAVDEDHNGGRSLEARAQHGSG
ncbi:MAG: hypothetical protein ACLUVF_10010 [Adlercreutzia sp.]